MIQIDHELCTSCALCGAVCPRYVTETVKEKDGAEKTVVTERQSICIDCGQCMAICSSGAIRVDSVAPEDLEAAPGAEIRRRPSEVRFL
jgi:NAD-dependent dihydropyrimidine dehydrogenase PreA subunit